MGVCIEGDWPDVALLHCYVTLLTPDLTLEEAFVGFTRFPRWMWRNEPVRDFVQWLRTHNAHLPPNKRCGIFGLDLYSLDTSMSAVIQFLEKNDPPNAILVKEFYSCFDRFGSDPQRYGMMATRSFDKFSCRNAVLDALENVIQKTQQYSRPNNGIHTHDMAFINEINARVVVDAERYYSAMFDSSASSWEVRDNHFFDCLMRVRRHLASTRSDDRVVVWAHNSHLGDARATSTTVGSTKELNIGQLIKQTFPDNSLSIGQFTCTGEVTAALDWGGDQMTMKVTKSLTGSWEDLLHVVSIAAHMPQYMLNLVDNGSTKGALTRAMEAGNKLERAIGVIYRPLTEMQSHYFTADLTAQFDICVWFDSSSAVGSLSVPETSSLSEEESSKKS